MNKISIARPYFPSEDITVAMSRIEGVLKSGMLMQGKYVEAFEKDFASYVGVAHGAAVNSGTSALQAALNYFDVRDSDVLLPVNTFLASANAILFEGGTPVFIDIRPDTLTMDVALLERALTPRTKGVMAVHIAGFIDPAIIEIKDFCARHGLFLIEDASHAHGARHGGIHAGAFGDAAAFSFLATKVITSGGEGGMVLTNDAQLMERVRSLRFHGEDHTRGIQDRVGYSWRMTEVQAILGALQVERLDEIIEKRMRVAKAYDAAFQKFPLVAPVVLPDGDRGAYYKYPLILDPMLRREIVKERLGNEFNVSSGTSYWPPCHLQPAYRNTFGYKEGMFPVAEDVLNRTIALPMHCHLTPEEISRVIGGVRRVCTT